MSERRCVSSARSDSQRSTRTTAVRALLFVDVEGGATRLGADGTLNGLQDLEDVVMPVAAAGFERSDDHAECYCANPCQSADRAEMDA